MAQKPQPIQVEIFGQSYTLRGGDRQRLQEIAAYVDQQMREVSRSAGAVDSVRIAVLAAMNMADELFRIRAGAGDAGEKATRAAAQKAAALAQQLAAVVDE